MSDGHLVVALLLCGFMGAGFIGSFVGDLLMIFLRHKGWWPHKKIVFHHVIDKTSHDPH